MKPLMTVLFIVFTCLVIKAQEYNAFKANTDSMLIYQTYKYQMEYIEVAAKEQNHKEWNNRTMMDDSLTSAAKRRLQEWNHTPYQPIDTKEREGFGTAYMYPQPGPMKKPKFSVVYTDTKFIVGTDGKTKGAYIEKVYFDAGGVAINVERLPVSTGQYSAQAQ